MELGLDRREAIGQPDARVHLGAEGRAFVEAEPGDERHPLAPVEDQLSVEGLRVPALVDAVRRPRALEQEQRVLLEVLVLGVAPERDGRREPGEGRQEEGRVIVGGEALLGRVASRSSGAKSKKSYDGVSHDPPRL